MKHFSAKWLVLPLFVLLLLQACVPEESNPAPARVADYSNKLALEWNEAMVQAERYSPGFAAPVSARSFAYVNYAAYEAAVHGMEGYNSLAGQFPGLSLPAYDAASEYNWPTVINHCYLEAVASFFPTMPDAQKALMISQAQERDNQFLREGFSLVTYERSRDFGRAVARAVYKWSESDAAGHEAYLKNTDPSYTAPQFAGSWSQTKPDFRQALLPYFGNARTFAITDAEKLAEAPMKQNSAQSSAYYAQMVEVYNAVLTLDPEQRWIAEFWSDDIQPMTFSTAARWIAVMNQLMVQQPKNLAESIQAYAMLGLALNDGGVACWRSKYTYNTERPVSYISKFISEDWQPHLKNPLTGEQGLTPASPAYPADHAAFSGAAGEVLSEVFGYETAFTDRCHFNRAEFIGTPRNFESFRDMAAESANSRILEGVQMRQDCDEGLALGKKIGQKAIHLKWKG